MCAKVTTSQKQISASFGEGEMYSLGGTIRPMIKLKNLGRRNSLISHGEASKGVGAHQLLMTLHATPFALIEEGKSSAGAAQAIGPHESPSGESVVQQPEK